MATERQKVYAGVFIVAAMAALVVTVAVIKRWLNSGGETYEVWFPEDVSVEGLKESATVRYSGVEIGRVTEVSLGKNAEGLVIAMATVEIENDCKEYLEKRPFAMLVMESLMAGQAVNLYAEPRDPDGEEESVKKERDAAWGSNETRRVIYAEKDTMTRILDDAPRVIEDVKGFVTKANVAIAKVNGFVDWAKLLTDENKSHVTGILANVNVLTGEGAPRLVTLLDRVDQLLRSADSRILAEGGSLDRLEGSIEQSLDSLTTDVSLAADQMAADVSNTLAATADPTRRTLDAVQLALADIRVLVREMNDALRGNREAFKETVAELRDAADAVEQTMLEYKNNRSSLIIGQPKKDRRAP